MFEPPDGSFHVGYVDGEPVATGAWRRSDVDALGSSRVAEVKRMYVAERVRGLGLARAMLAHLEASVAAYGVEVVVLETGLAQPEAIGLYESSGYKPIPAFGYYRYAPQLALLRQAPADHHVALVGDRAAPVRRVVEHARPSAPGPASARSAEVSSAVRPAPVDQLPSTRTSRPSGTSRSTQRASASAGDRQRPQHVTAQHDVVRRGRERRVAQRRRPRSWCPGRTRPWRPRGAASPGRGRRRRRRCPPRRAAATACRCRSRGRRCGRRGRQERRSAGCATRLVRRGRAARGPARRRRPPLRRPTAPAPERSPRDSRLTPCCSHPRSPTASPTAR